MEPWRSLWQMGHSPRDKLSIPVVPLSVAYRLTIEICDPATGGKQDGVPRRRVPLHGRAEARVSIGVALGDGTEFQ